MLYFVVIIILCMATAFIHQKPKYAQKASLFLKSSFTSFVIDL